MRSRSTLKMRERKRTHTGSHSTERTSMPLPSCGAVHKRLTRDTLSSVRSRSFPLFLLPIRGTPTPDTASPAALGPPHHSPRSPVPSLCRRTRTLRSRPGCWSRAAHSSDQVIKPEWSAQSTTGESSVYTRCVPPFTSPPPQRPRGSGMRVGRWARGTRMVASTSRSRPLS